MDIQPAYAAFETAYRDGANQVLWTRIPADLDTPVSMMLKLTEARRHSFLLESVTGGETRGRYSIVGMKPDLIWRCRDGAASINRDARFDDDAFRDEALDPLASLRALCAESAVAMPDGLPPMAAGLFGYIGYDMVRLVETTLGAPNPDPLDLPDAVMIRPTVVAVLDNVRDEVTLIAPVWSRKGADPRAAYARAAERLSDALDALDRTPATERAPSDMAWAEVAPVSNTTEERYRDMVAEARRYIAAGDIFQVVPSQRWASPFPLPPFSLYRALRRTNPSPYMFYFNFGAYHVAGASPETLVKVRGDRVTIRPIAGTRPRGETPAQDAALEAELLADPKELAEHLMLLDLGRNDVGRVAKIGTVDPNAQFTVERYSHVMHIVSNVEGVLREDQDALSALFAGLPAGTVSGAPKVRAMQIIDELETEKRGVYAGGVGYLSSGGDMDLCIALRTAVLKDQVMYVQAGGGVVHDSDPESERMETVHKARALMRAAQEAARFAGRGANR